MNEFIVEDRDGTRRVPIGKQMSIGRGPNNDLVLSAMFASRRHAWVWRQGDRFIVQDLSSTNGTYVNGRRLARPQFLNHNDLLMMGDGQLTFVTRWDSSREHTPPQGVPRMMASQVFCAHCGAPNHLQTGICTNCGRTIHTGIPRERKTTEPRPSFTPTDPDVARPFPDTRASPKPRARSGAWILILLLVIIAVAFMIILGLLVFYVVS
jgi:hypothetical protein